MTRRFSPIVAAAFIIFSTFQVQAQDVKTVHGLSLFGDVKYPADFKHFDYVNPDAPKGGTVRMPAMGAFDSLNPFILKGQPAGGVGLIYDSLMSSSLDEPSTEYGLLVEKVDVPSDFSFVTFYLRPEARWHDGKPVTPEDVIWTFNTLKEKGRPIYRYYYANVVEAEKVGDRAVKFIFSEGGNRELPQIMGQLTILPKHYYEDVPFEETSLKPPLGSGPYRVAEVSPGRRLVMERVEDYWGKDLPVNVGQNNFDRYVFEYFRDTTVMFEAFKGDQYDIHVESSSKNWAIGYDFPAIKAGKVKKEELTIESAEPMQAFVLNTRRNKFSDPRVRQAFNYAFDFEWANKNLFYGQYSRVGSYFQNTEMMASGIPEGEELKLLEPFKDQLPDDLFSKPYENPKTDGSGNNRSNLRRAKQLLDEAGWTIEEGVLTGPNGEQMEVEFLLRQPNFERIVAPFIKGLERLGVKATIRTVDTSQYQNRMDKFDFDIAVGSWLQSLSPGNEQREYWSSAAADREGSRNLPGIKDPVVDALIDKIIFAKDREALVTASRALDRVLLWGHYVVPQWYTPATRLAYWNRFDHPAKPPRYSLGIPSTWWAKK